MDSTAYPHILERIIQQCCSVDTLLAFRATSRHCRATADDTLFYHAVLRREYKGGRVRKLLRRITAPERSAKLRLVLALPASSPIQQDRRLPLLPAKVTVLDLEPTPGGEPPVYQRVYRTRMIWTMEEIPYQIYNSFDYDAVADCKPAVLRRFGDMVQVKYGPAQGTTVDFVRACNPSHPYHNQLIVVPVPARRYVLHLDWTTCEPPGRWFSLGGHSKSGIPEAVLVLTPRTAAMSLDTVAGIINLVAKEFMPSMKLGLTAFTVVGVEDGQECMDSLRGQVVQSYLKYRIEYGAPEVDEDAVARAYDGIRFISLEEWRASLGHLQDVVGMWPSPAQHMP